MFAQKHAECTIIISTMTIIIMTIIIIGLT
jgi:hypothetical protein